MNLKQVEFDTIERYNKRFIEFGINPKTLGWSDSETQLIRFDTLTKYLDLNNKSILDIGCGFGDLLHYLDNRIKILSYTGIDINKLFIDICNDRYDDKRFNFKTANILTDILDLKADISVAFGLLNYKIDDNLEYVEKFIERAWDLTNENLILDFLSSMINPNYPIESNVFYYNICDILDICFQFTNNLIMIHNYEPIPQKEFMVILNKK